MKVLVTGSPGYSFDEDIVGNTYEVVDADVKGVYIVVDHEHDSAIKYEAGTVWYLRREDVRIIQGSVQKAPKKAKQKPPVRQQTIVYFLYVDGTDYQQRRVKGVVVNADHKAIHVDTERNLGQGLVIRENSTIPFNLLDAVRVSTPDGEYCYYFDKGQIVGTARDFTKNAPFRTVMH